MSEPARLTDRTSLLQHRQRACRSPDGIADFLHRFAADEIEQRLEEVNRTFKDQVVVSGFPRLWQGLRPDARQIEDTDTLDLEPGTCDLVIHALCLHWADDPVGQLVQARRALRADGLFLAVLFGGRTLAELRAVTREAEIAETGGLSPRVAPMGDLRDFGALLQRAGFALPVADAQSLSVSYKDAFHLMADLRAMGETNALALRHRVPPPRGLFARINALYSDRWADEEGRIPATFELVFLTGWAPHDSQQKPLRPGSASARLADVLATEERRLPGPRD